jgi:hypothetical protein
VSNPTARIDSIKNQNPATLEARKKRCEELLRKGSTREDTIKTIKAEFGVGLGGLAVNKIAKKLKREKRKNQREFDFALKATGHSRPKKTTRVEAPSPSTPATTSLILGILEQGYRCFIHTDGQLELRK